MDPTCAWIDAVRGSWDAARTRWPGVEVAEEAFLAYVEARVPQEDRTPESMTAVHGEELYLACGCAKGQPAAIAAFEQTYFSKVDAALARIRGLGDQAEDVKQALRQDLFSSQPDAPPKIEAYSGRGSLLGWVRIAVVRSAHKLVHRERKEAPMAEHLLAEAAEESRDEELEYFKRLYRREFKEAFEAAVTGLQRRERNLLRHHIVDQLSIDQISAVYHVHRSTAARQIERARQSLREQTREHLLAKLDVAPEELESIVRMVETQIDLSVYRVLGGPTRT